MLKLILVFLNVFGIEINIVRGWGGRGDNVGLFVFYWFFGSNCVYN